MKVGKDAAPRIDTHSAKNSFPPAWRNPGRLSAPSPSARPVHRGCPAAARPRGAADEALCQAGFVPRFGVVGGAGQRLAGHGEAAAPRDDDLHVEPASVTFPGVHARGGGVGPPVTGRDEETVDAHRRAQRRGGGLRCLWCQHRGDHRQEPAYQPRHRRSGSSRTARPEAPGTDLR